MEEPTVMYQEGPAVSGEPIAACLLSGETRRTFLRRIITLAWSGERASSRPGMEWVCRDNNIGCLRVVGVWCLLIWGRLVPAEVARVVKHGKGASPYSDWGCTVG